MVYPTGDVLGSDTLPYNVLVLYRRSSVRESQT
jgi:hypothetical protein